MDPLSALGIAASVAQFVQFGASLVSKSREIYKQGSLLDQTECKIATDRLAELASRVKESVDELEALGQLSPDSRALKLICETSIRLSNELGAHLDRLKMDPASKLRTWKSFRQAFKSVCSKDKIDGLARKLQATRDELNIHLVESIVRKADMLALNHEQALMALKDSEEKTVNAVFDSREQLKVELSDQSKGLIDSIIKSHENTGATILHALGEAQSVEVQLLRSLEYSGMDDRHVEIVEAHRKTFRWILDGGGQEGARLCDFAEWLKGGSGVYWINGKAGSGKSTLMRFIFDDATTMKHLTTWAQGSELEVGGFFFWMSGFREQRSYTGLLRSLLYQVLHRRPDIIRQVFPNEWKEGKSNTKMFGLKFSWQPSALEDAFKRWIHLTSGSSKLCFFIDGLDEYDGDHEEMAEFLRELSSDTTHIKFCLSSRPWVVFDDAFEGVPSLRLQDLTFADIQAYVSDKLADHRRMQQLAEANPELALQLTTEIVTKASGVFLWVTLVVKSLLDGLRNRDTIVDLQRRLRDLPQDLASLYSHMLKHVEPLYQRKAAETFQIFSAMERCSAVPSLWLEVAITGNRDHLREHVQFYPNVIELRNKLEWLDVHLKSRCAGLLEIVGGSGRSPNPSRKDLYASRVRYLHRTVAEFLVADDVRAVTLEAAESDFDPNFRAIIGRIYAVKKCRIFNNQPEGIWGFVEETMSYAKSVQEADKICYISILDDLEQATAQSWTKYQGESPNSKIIPFDRKRYFQTAVKQGLRNYVEAKFKIWSPKTSDYGRTLLSDAFKMLDRYGHVTPAGMYELLLAVPWEDGPNHMYRGPSPWQKFLTEVHTYADRDWMSKDYLKALAHVFKVMLNHGANPQTTCTKNHCIGIERRDLAIGSHTVKHVIIDVFKRLLPGECADLMELLEEMIEIQERQQQSQSTAPSRKRVAMEAPSRQTRRKRR